PVYKHHINLAKEIDSEDLQSYLEYSSVEEYSGNFYADSFRFKSEAITYLRYYDLIYTNIIRNRFYHIGCSLYLKHPKDLYDHVFSDYISYENFLADLSADNLALFLSFKARDVEFFKELLQSGVNIKVWDGIIERLMD